ncbi:MAG TPA: hypothetical protein VM754_08965 [Actinomycetota bacterium]|nr:hypothetical protein [Actinomycetota bacterium]
MSNSPEDERIAELLDQLEHATSDEERRAIELKLIAPSDNRPTEADPD